MKKRYKIIIIFILVIIICIISKNKIKGYIENEKMEKEWVDYLNCEKRPFYVSEEAFYNRCNNIYKLEYHQIDEVIEDYLKCLEKALRRKVYNEEARFNSFFKANQLCMHGLSDSTIIYLCNLMTEEDIEDYNNGIFEDKIVKKLEEVFEHRSKENYKEWYVKNDKNKTFELPFNVYANYKYDDTIYLNEVRKVLNIKINKDGKHCMMKYESTDGSIKDEKLDVLSDVYIDESGNSIKYKYCYSTPLYFKYSQTPDITFGQHDYDAYRKKKNEEFKEWANSVDRLSPKSVYEE